MKALFLMFALASAGAAHAVENCDVLRAQIESKITASGVSGFSVTVADATATVPGQVVGACELGTKKIVYARDATAAGTVAAAPARAPAPGGGMLTECKDGTTSMGGNCRP